MKPILITALLLAVNLTSFSQKYVNAKKVKMSYTQFPTSYAIQEYKTWYFLYEGLSNRRQVEERIDLPGFERVTDKAKADIVVAITQYEVTSTPPIQKKTNKTKKNKDGSTSSYTVYSYSSTISTTYVSELRLTNGSVVDSRTETIEKPYTGSSSESPETAKGLFESGLNDKEREAALEGFQKTYHPIREKYCFIKKPTYASFVGFKFKKHDYSALNKISDEATLLLEKELSEEIKTKLKVHIASWEKELSLLEEGNNKARINEKVTGGLYYNIALAWFFMEDYQQALTFINKAAEINNSVQNTQYIIKTVSEKNIRNAKANN